MQAGGGAPAEQPSASGRCAPEQISPLGQVWMSLSIVDSTSVSPTGATRKCPKIRGVALFFSSKGDSSPYPYIPCVQVKVTSERTGTFCKIECDHYII